MQDYLQDFALALLETNPSWSDRAVIQNLVIWEPVGPVIPMKKVSKFFTFSYLFSFLSAVFFTGLQEEGEEAQEEGLRDGLLQLGRNTSFVRRNHCGREISFRP